MSLFGYPAIVTQYHATLDVWNRVTGYNPVELKAKVIEEQKRIKNAEGEEVLSIAEIHLEGLVDVNMQDYFEYVDGLERTMKYSHVLIQPQKILGTDRVKKVIIYA